MFDNPCGQLHQRSITSAFNYNRTYSTSSINLSSENEWISLTGVPRKQNSNLGMHQLLPISLLQNMLAMAGLRI